MDQQERHLYDYIEELRREAADSPPVELDGRDIEFAEKLVAAHQSAPGAAARQRMWQAALALATNGEPMGEPDVAMTETTLSVESQSPNVVKMPSRRNFPLTAAASLIVAVLAGLFMALMNIPQETRPDIVNLVATQVSDPGVPEGFMPVVMASVAMAPGTQISEDMLMTVMWPEEMPLPGPIYTDPDALVGQYVRGQTSQTMPLLEFNMTEDGPRSFEMPEEIVTEL